MLNLDWADRMSENTFGGVSAHDLSNNLKLILKGNKHCLFDGYPRLSLNDGEYIALLYAVLNLSSDAQEKIEKDLDPVQLVFATKLRDLVHSKIWDPCCSSRYNSEVQDAFNEMNDIPNTQTTWDFDVGCINRWAVRLRKAIFSMLGLNVEWHNSNAHIETQEGDTSGTIPPYEGAVKASVEAFLKEGLSDEPPGIPPVPHEEQAFRLVSPAKPRAPAREPLAAPAKPAAQVPSSANVAVGGEPVKKRKRSSGNPREAAVEESPERCEEILNESLRELALTIPENRYPGGKAMSPCACAIIGEMRKNLAGCTELAEKLHAKFKMARPTTDRRDDCNLASTFIMGFKTIGEQYPCNNMIPEGCTLKKICNLALSIWIHKALPEASGNKELFGVVKQQLWFMKHLDAVFPQP